MKIILLLIAGIVFSCASQPATAPNVTAPIVNEPQESGLTLDEAAAQFASYIGERLPEDTRTAVATMEAPVKSLAEYATDKLIEALLDNKQTSVLSRQDFERIVAEQQFQLNMGANFDPESTAKIGHNLGWSTLIFGKIVPLNTGYQATFRAVDVESGELRGAKIYTILGADPVLSNLVKPKQPAQEDLFASFNGTKNDFTLKVWPTSQKTLYYDKDEIFINLEASEDCYFVVYQVDVNNQMQVIYPNFWEQNKNTLTAGVTRTIPEDTSFVLHEPYGEERILVYASQSAFKIPPEQFNAKPVSPELLDSHKGFSPADDSKGMSVVPRGATAQFTYKILPK